MAKIAFTTSRYPSNKTRSFIKDIITVVPNSGRFTRGSQNLRFILTKLQSEGFNIAIVINSVKGNPNFWRVFNLSDSKPTEYPFAIKLRGLTLSRDYKAKKIRQPKKLLLISSVDPKDEEILRIIFNISMTESIADNSKKSDFLTMYADYIDKDEKIIFIEFLDSSNDSVGPRLKLKIIPRRIEAES